MGVGIQSEAGGEVSEHSAHRLNIHAVLECDGGEGVAEVMESDLWDPGSGQHSLEHIVDAVLYFEGERNLSFRILRAVKNRFGSTNEIGVFEMMEKGLSEVENPSEMLISGRPKNTPGSWVACVMEGEKAPPPIPPRCCLKAILSRETNV